MKESTNIELIVKQMVSDILLLNIPAKSNLANEVEKLRCFLETNPDIKINQELQLKIVRNIQTRKLIICIPNITGKTIIEFLRNIPSYNMDSIKILFSLYEEKIKPNLEEFIKNEYSKPLKIELLKKIKKQDVIAFQNLEYLDLFNKINNKLPELDDEDIKNIVANNPYHIAEISNPSVDLQLLAAKKMLYPIEILELIENPSNLLYAHLLTIYSYENSHFKGKFKNGVPKEIIDEVIKINPRIAFDCANFTGHKFTLEEKEEIVGMFPEVFKHVTNKDITPTMILNAVKHSPRNLEYIGKNLNLYSQPILDYAKTVLAEGSTPENQKEFIQVQQKIISDYQEVIDKRNEEITKQTVTDNEYLTLVKQINTEIY